MTNNQKEIIQILKHTLQIGTVLTDSRTELLDWNKRMILAAFEPYGVSFPDDWDKLSEDVKEDRLNRVIMLIEEMDA
jgi:hypothetical protein